MTVNMEREERLTCLEDPVPPPPSPTPETTTVTRLVVGPLEPLTISPQCDHPGRDRLQEDSNDFRKEQHPDVTLSEPTTSADNSIVIPSSTATIDLLQKTSRTLSIECKGRLLSTSPASPASVTPDVCSTPRSPRQLIHPIHRLDDKFGRSPPSQVRLSSVKTVTVSSAIDHDDHAVVETTEEPLRGLQFTEESGKQGTVMIEEDKPGQYRLKWVKFNGSKIPIITQNENGPCPLIAIMNVLLLKGKLRLPLALDIVTSDQLMEYLGDCILSSLPSNLNEGAQLNYEQNMMDAIAILPKLQTGLDVNVKFTSISDFEFTPELIVFDLLHIPLHHGWLVDAVNFPPGMAAAVGSCSYNQLVDKIITNKSSTDSDLVTEAIMAEEFLESTASQLTYFGLKQLVTFVKEDDPCVLFRNNHFITLYRHHNQLFQLVTDQGFLNEPSVIWETLNNIEGDGKFVDEDFKVVPPKAPSLLMTEEDVRIQEDQDYLIALSLQEEYKKEVENMKEWEQAKLESGFEGLSDEELARKLQAEEEARIAKDQRQTKEIADSSPPTRASSSSTSLHRVHGTQGTLTSKSPSTFMSKPLPRAFEEDRHPRPDSESSHHRVIHHVIHQEQPAMERPSSPTSRRERIPPRKSASMQEHGHGPRMSSGDSAKRPGSERHRQDHHHSEHSSRSGGKSSKSSCSVM